MRRAFKIFAQSAEAAIKGLCASYEIEKYARAARVSRMFMLNARFLPGIGSRLKIKWAAL